MGMYTLRNFAITGDATGGEHTLSVIMDPNYCSMLGYASMQIDLSAANRGLHWQFASSAVPAQFENITLARLASGIQGAQIAHTWMPPSMINPGGVDQVPTLICSVVNTDTEILNLQAVIFLFDIRARESALYSHLIAARGAQYSSGDG